MPWQYWDPHKVVALVNVDLPYAFGIRTYLNASIFGGAVVLGQYYHDVSLRALSEMLQLTNPSGARAALLAAQRRLRKCLEASGIESVVSEGFA